MSPISIVVGGILLALGYFLYTKARKGNKWARWGCTALVVIPILIILVDVLMIVLTNS
ncbi:MAG: hypothetical protein JXB07_04460 [Anaerolineae bacterium]|nr:hypothetical protein [Anaerolineae bacterium]